MNQGLLSCGIDIHHKESEIHLIAQDGTLIAHDRIKTDSKAIGTFFEKYQDYQIQYAIEACGMTRYVHRQLNALANTTKIHIVNPYKFKVITESKKKNDKNDSKHLAEGLLRDYLPKPVYLKREEAQRLQGLLNLRRRRVETRKKIIVQAKAQLRGQGVQLKTVSLITEKGFNKILEATDGETFLTYMLKILKEDLIYENKRIKECEEEIKKELRENFLKEFDLLVTIPGIGFVIATTIIAHIDKIERFERAGQVSDYCGLVPSEYSSGEKVSHGRITKQGVTELRTLLIQAAWVVIRLKRQDDERLTQLKKKFYKMTQKDRCCQKGITAIARHLSRIVFGVLKHQQKYSGKIEQNLKQTQSLQGPKVYKLNV